MYRSAWRVSVLVGGVVLTAGCNDGPAAPSPTLQTSAPAFTEFTATDLPVALLDPGTLELLPARMLMTGFSLRSRIDATDPRFTGFMEATLSASWNLMGEGPVWGKFSVDVDGGGRWEGFWRAQRSVTGVGLWTSEATWTARGVEGSVAGLHATGSETILTTDLLPAAFVGQIVGRIIE